jgi:hypothetical protein
LVSPLLRLLDGGVLERAKKIRWSGELNTKTSGNLKERWD